MNSSPGRDAMLPLAFSQSLGGDDLRLSSAPSSGSTGPSSAPDQSIQSFAHIGDVNGRTTPLKLSNLDNLGLSFSSGLGRSGEQSSGSTSSLIDVDKLDAYDINSQQRKGQLLQHILSLGIPLTIAGDYDWNALSMRYGVSQSAVQSTYSQLIATCRATITRSLGVPVEQLPSDVRDSLEGCKLTVARMMLFFNVRSVLLRSPYLDLILRSPPPECQRPATFPVWWTPDHDKGLLHGIDKYGFDDIESICRDPELEFATTWSQLNLRHDNPMPSLPIPAGPNSTEVSDALRMPSKYLLQKRVETLCRFSSLLASQQLPTTASSSSPSLLRELQPAPPSSSPPSARSPSSSSSSSSLSRLHIPNPSTATSSSSSSSQQSAAPLLNFDTIGGEEAEKLPTKKKRSRRAGAMSEHETTSFITAIHTPHLHTPSSHPPPPLPAAAQLMGHIRLVKNPVKPPPHTSAESHTSTISSFDTDHNTHTAASSSHNNVLLSDGGKAKQQRREG